MAFTTRSFPNKVFESLTEYDEYLKFRTTVQQRLVSKIRSNPARVVKVAGAIRKEDPIYKTLQLWISQLERT